MTNQHEVGPVEADRGRMNLKSAAITAAIALVAVIAYDRYKASKG